MNSPKLLNAINTGFECGSPGEFKAKIGQYSGYNNIIHLGAGVEEVKVFGLHLPIFQRRSEIKIFKMTV